MNKGDKDSHQKQSAIRYCLALGRLPCPEVVIYSPSDLTSTPEPLTDLDVLGVEALDDGGLRRTLFDCKSGNRMSAINRALWVRGLMDFIHIDHGVVILRSPPLENHRLAALDLSVDIHSEDTFTGLGNLISTEFSKDLFYQSDVERWRSQIAAYRQCSWSAPLHDCVRHLAPVTKEPYKIFRRLIAELRAVRGEFDPSKDKHRTIYYDSLCGMLLLWSAMSRDIRRLYREDLPYARFEELLRYYIWGGQETYHIRQEMAKKVDKESPSVEMPEWPKLQKFVSNVVTDPGSALSCASFSRELSIRESSGVLSDKDDNLRNILKSNHRVAQFLLSASDYLTSAGKLPREFYDHSAGILADLS